MAQLWIGPPKSGKTSLQEFFAKLIGDSATAIPFRDIIQDKGAICGLKGNRLNISSEIGGAHLNRRGIDRLKSIIADELLNGRDAYRQRESWYNTTKFIFTSNNLPNPRDADTAFWRRFQIIEFTQDFEGREDPTLFQRILDEEASQVIAYLLQYVSRVKETLKPSIVETELLWHLFSGSIANFLNQEVLYAANEFISCQDFYERYRSWCKKHKFRPISKKKSVGIFHIRKIDEMEYMSIWE